MTFFGYQIANASPVTLKCVASNGQKVSDLTIDIARKEMIWGKHIQYDITHVDGLYISAYRKDGIGGEVWVINRITGAYKRAAVGIHYTTPYKPGDKGSFKAQIHEGRCGKQQF